MKDFSERHRHVVHFGLWAEESADDYGQLDALKILEAAAKRTYEHDMRGEDLEDALAFLKTRNQRRPFEDFRVALDVRDPRERYHRARHALVRIKIAMKVGG